MNFFEHQDQARQNTQKLILLFGLSLLVITITVYFAAVVTLSGAFSRSSWRSHSNESTDCSTVIQRYSQQGRLYTTRMPCPEQVKAFSWWNPSLFVNAAIGTVVLVGLGSLYKIQLLRSGGRVIAQEMGGRMLVADMANPAERQLLNVVEEMAIAAGIPVPAVYVMDREPGINAFAAGYSANDAVIGVTQGTLDLLNRDELQGVIGHEFSHILNGDMRLNIRLIGVLHGLLLIYITGRILLRWRSRNEKGNGIALFGMALIVIGSLGLLCGRLIKSAISRQREFLADASSVQFTRNPAGIAGALDKISAHSYNSLVLNPAAEGNSHLFFGSALRFHFFENLFATHPPLAQRIQRLDASKRHYATRSPAATSGQDARAIGFAGGASSGIESSLQGDPAQVVAQIGTVTPEHFAYAKALVGLLPEPLQLGIRESQSAIAIVYGLLLDTQDPAMRTKQIDWLRRVEPAEAIETTLALSAEIDALDPQTRLPLLDLAVPMLRQLPVDQCQRVLKCIQGLAMADGNWSLSEFVLYVVLRHRLQSTIDPASNASIAQPEFTRIGQIWSDCLLLLSGLAQMGQADPEAIVYAFRSGAFRLPGAGQESLPDLPPNCSLGALKQSIDRLNRATPKLKQAIVDACAHTVLLDNKVTVQEAELLRAIVILLDCPMPPFLTIRSNQAQ